MEWLLGEIEGIGDSWVLPLSILASKKVVERPKRSPPPQAPALCQMTQGWRHVRQLADRRTEQAGP